MKARTLGPALMIVFGVVTLASPAYSSISAGVIDPCSVPGSNTTVPCCESTVVLGEVAVCDTVPDSTTSATTAGGEGSGAGIPDTGGDSTATVVLGVSLVAGGAALIVATRRRPKAVA